MGTWLETFRPLYGVSATPALAAQQAEFERCAPATPEAAAARYRATISAAARHALGEYFTPEWLAELALDRLGYEGKGTLLDPSAGLGIFVDRALKRGGEAAGYEVNPVTAKLARAMGLPVATRDTLCDPGTHRFDFIAGNPPWVNWRHINPQYRKRIAPLWDHYGLLPEGRLGAAMDDLSILFTYVSADRLLAKKGRLAFLLPRTLFQSAGGGRKFRRFELPGGEFLCVLSVEEVGGSTTFQGASTQAVLAIFEKRETRMAYPVAYLREGTRWNAEPVSADPTSPWIVTRHGPGCEMSRMRGPSDYVARVGAHSGGAAGVYWVDVLERNGSTAVIRNRSDSGRNKWPEVTARIEVELVYGLVRGRNIARWSAHSSHGIVLPHSCDGRAISRETMASRYPLALAYFENFRTGMCRRPHYRRHFLAQQLPYWSMYNVGPYTFAPYRVVWREQSRTMQAAVIEEPRWIADAKLTVVACQSAAEARYLATILNAVPARDFVEAYVLPTQISTHVLRNLRVPRFDPADEWHQILAGLYGGPEDRITHAVKQIYGLT